MNQIISELSLINILVIEDNPGDFFLIEEYLSEASPNIVANHCSNLENAVSFLEKNSSEYISKYSKIKKVHNGR